MMIHGFGSEDRDATERDVAWSDGGGSGIDIGAWSGNGGWRGEFGGGCADSEGGGGGAGYGAAGLGAGDIGASFFGGRRRREGDSTDEGGDCTARDRWAIGGGGRGRADGPSDGRRGVLEGRADHGRRGDSGGGAGDARVDPEEGATRRRWDAVSRVQGFASVVRRIPQRAAISSGDGAL